MPSFSQSIIEALRRNSAKYDLKLEFIGDLGDRYDLLKPGEYILYLYSGGYEFGIIP